jgi:hypothetical protein
MFGQKRNQKRNEEANVQKDERRRRDGKPQKLKTPFRASIIPGDRSIVWCVACIAGGRRRPQDGVSLRK